MTFNHSLQQKVNGFVVIFHWFDRILGVLGQVDYSRIIGEKMLSGLS